MKFVVYSKPMCPNCEKAKALLTLKKKEFQVVHVDVGQVKNDGEMYISPEDLKLKYPGVSSVPQIVLDDKLIGGYTQLDIFFKNMYYM